MMKPKRYKVVHPSGIDLGGRHVPVGEDFTPGVDVAAACERLARAGKLGRVEEDEKEKEKEKEKPEDGSATRYVNMLARAVALLESDAPVRLKWPAPADAT